MFAHPPAMEEYSLASHSWLELHQDIFILLVAIVEGIVSYFLSQTMYCLYKGEILIF